MPRLAAIIVLLVSIPILMVFANADEPKKHPTPEPTPGEEAISEAITILQARKAKAEAKADQDKIAQAIAALEKLLKTEKAEKGFEITSELVKKRFHGKSSYNSKTGVLILVYDFKTKDQLDDFDLMGSKPKLRNGNLMLEGGESILHVAKFKTLTLNTTVRGKPDNYFIKIQNTCGFWSGGNVVGLAVLDEQGKPTEDVLERRLPPGTTWPVEMTVTAKRLGLKVGTIRLGKAKNIVLAGQVELTGGKKGNTIHGLVLEGTLDAEWAQEFFKEKK